MTAVTLRFIALGHEIHSAAQNIENQGDFSILQEVKVCHKQTSYVCNW